MKNLRRWLVALLVIVALGGVLEFSLRAFIPSLIEGGARVALRVPQTQEVTVDTHGSMVMNALQWRIADVTVTAAGVPLADDMTADATLDIGSMPLFPAFGKLRDGTATFTVPADQLDRMVRLASGGLAKWGEMRDGQLVGGGVLTDAQFDLPYSPAFEIAYEGVVDLSVENGDIVVVPSSLVVHDEGPVGAFLAGAIAEPRTVCFADRLPTGVTLTDIQVQPSGEVIMSAQLSERLLSRVDERLPGRCA